ncbi:membrane fusion protein (multidrug efflux system) [Chitinophaga terrae (ex Kim and Jung 2007)]|uniref:HlyD family secretion protein n=1 Tax=Chitinophaga terrae (ex Kim and Jung 2007) TaxID=408074 RepID=UPI00277F4021|nr:HlyD family secretion protein [Chitinophaga terrae (ex Kim and Jung 2007)]MDQ0106082.1 membrane fusion protein (multidrug efflux system) [Chitinophaga terrae (ex Kim and Jung 2007)]
MKKNYIVTDRLITRITGWMAGLIVLALAIWGGYTIWHYYRFEETNDAQVQEYVNPVISRAGGFIVAVKFEENQPVKRGDTLLIIDNREYVLQQEQTEAAIRKAEAQLQVLESNIHTLERTAGAASAQISGARAKVWKQQLDFDRYQQMYKEEAATRQQLENMQATLDVNNSEYKTATENFNAASSRIADVRAEKEVVQAELKRLKALLDRHKLDVSYTVITASYDGRMGRRTVEVGQMIDAGEVLAYIVNNETDKWVVANYKETQVANMTIGDTVEIVADAYPGQTFRGTVISLSPATGSSFSLLPPDNSTGNYVKIVQRIPVRIRVDGQRKEIDKLKVGMNVNVYLPKHQHHG